MAHSGRVIQKIRTVTNAMAMAVLVKPKASVSVPPIASNARNEIEPRQ